MKLLLDEDSQAKYLFNLLQAAGHDIVTVNELNLMSRPDDVVLEYARQSDRTVLTRNCADFQALHQENPDHSGILAVYQNLDPSKNMSYQDIVSSIANLEAASYALKGQFVILNQWN